MAGNNMTEVQRLQQIINNQKDTINKQSDKIKELTDISMGNHEKCVSQEKDIANLQQFIKDQNERIHEMNQMRDTYMKKIQEESEPNRVVNIYISDCKKVTVIPEED